MQSGIAFPAGPAPGATPDRLRLLEDVRNRCARKDVVKLLEQQRTPVRCNGGLTGGCEQGSNGVLLPEQSFQAAVVSLLIRATGGTAAVQLQVELIAPDRQLRRERLQALQEAAQRSRLLRQGHRLGLPQRHLFKHFLRRPTAVIADTRDPERLLHTGLIRPGALLLQHLQRIAPAADRRQHQAEQLSSVAAPPTEQAMGKGMRGIPGQFVGAEPAHACIHSHRRQTRRKPEAVRQPGQMVVPFRERGSAVGLSLRELPPERSGADQHAVGLHPGPVDRLPAAGLTGPADRGEQGGAMVLEPVVQGRRGMSEAELRPSLHQIQGRPEGALSGLPGVRHRPEPGQIQMGMTQPVHRTRRRSRSRQMLRHRLERCRLQGVELLPVRRQVTPGGVMQRQGFGQQQGVGRRLLGTGFQVEHAADQGTVVMQRTAHLQLQVQRRSGPTALRQRPATGRIEEVAFMDEDAIHPEADRFGPPAQTQPDPTILFIPPGLRPAQLLLQAQPLTSPGPDQQTALNPVRPVDCAPILLNEPLLLRGPRSSPFGLQIPSGATAKRFNPLLSAGLKGGLPPGTAVMPHRMLSQSQTTVGLHARPQDLRLLGRLLLSGNFCLRLPGERSQPDPQPQGPRGLRTSIGATAPDTGRLQSEYPR